MSVNVTIYRHGKYLQFTKRWFIPYFVYKLVLKTVSIESSILRKALKTEHHTHKTKEKEKRWG